LEFKILGQELAYEDRFVQKTRRNHALAEWRREMPGTREDAYRIVVRLVSEVRRDCRRPPLCP